MRTTKRAPLWLIALAGAVAIGQGLGLRQMGIDSTFYGEAAGAPSLALRWMIGVLWCLGFAGLCAGLIGKRRIALRLCGPIFSLYALANLAILALFARSDYDRGRIGFEALLSLLVLTPVWWVTVRGRRTGA